jgi:cobalt-zinc-cadmium resistance protein CzcA
MIVYLPILTLEGIEGKLFRPMALTVIFALLGSMILSVTLMPVLASLVLPRHIEHREPLLMRGIKRLYLPVLKLAMRHKAAVIGLALSMLLAAVMIALSLGSEFVPRLSEGALAVSVVRRTGTDLENSVKYNTLMEKALLAEFAHEIQHVWSRIGTAEIATDPMGTELTDMFLALKPQNLWTKARSQAELTAKIERFLRDMPGQKLTFLQPIEMRMNEMITGSRADVAVQVYGDDLNTLVAQAARVEAMLKEIPGATDVSTEQMAGLQPVLQIKLDQEQLARYGVPATVVTDVIEAIGSKPLGDVVDGQLRFPLVARLPDELREGAAGVESIMIPTASGQLPLSRLARIERVTQPATINREWGQRRVTVSANVRGRDLGNFVTDARAGLAGLTLPSQRYSYKIGGQFEHLEQGRNRLLIVVPLALVLIFGLLYATYGNVLDALRVFSGVPFACVGGVFALWLRDMPFSISAGVGFVALSGVAVLDDMILVSYNPSVAGQGALHRAGRGRGGHHPTAARVDDHAGGRVGVPADGHQHGRGGGSAAPAGHRGHRGRHQRHGHVAAGAARAVCRGTMAGSGTEAGDPKNKPADDSGDELAIVSRRRVQR